MGTSRRAGGWVLAVALAFALPRNVSATELGVKGEQFTINGTPAFLLGCSYYAGLGASTETVRADLDELKRHGFNWVRVWATWGAFGNDVSAVAGDTGGPRSPYAGRLKQLIEEADQRGMVVNVTLSRGNGATGSPRLQGLDAHRRAVETVLGAGGERRNWYIDLSNERNIQDKRFTSFDDLADLRLLVKRRDPLRLVTASHAGELSKEDVEAYLRKVPVDFISWHRPRDPQSPAQTAKKTKQARKWVGEVMGAGKAVPLHYDEPFRRGYDGWDPKAEDFWTDLEGARSGGAAGWCFHNGSQRNGRDGRPRRSFDLSDRTLFSELDAEEKRFLARLLEERNRK